MISTLMPGQKKKKIKNQQTKKRFQITCEDDTLREKWMRERVPRSGWTSQRKRSARERRFSTQHGPDRHQQFRHTLHSSFVSGRDRRGGRVSRNLTRAYTRSFETLRRRRPFWSEDSAATSLLFLILYSSGFQSAVLILDSDWSEDGHACSIRAALHIHDR